MPKPSPGTLVTDANNELRKAMPDQFELFFQAIGSVSGAVDYLITKETKYAIGCCKDAIKALENIKENFPLKEKGNQRLVTEALEKLNAAMAQLDPKESLMD